MNFSSFLAETASADLYHATKIPFAIEQLSSNEIIASTGHRYWKDGRRISDRKHESYDDHVWIKGISLTRDLTFAKKWASIGTIFVFDQQLLRNKYKILPIKWGKAEEFEEFLWVDTSKITGDGPEVIRYLDNKEAKIKNLSSFLKKIIYFAEKDFRTAESKKNFLELLSNYSKMHSVKIDMH